MNQLYISYFKQFDSLAVQLAARGVTLIAASNDSGEHNINYFSWEYTPLFPASSQYVRYNRFRDRLQQLKLFI